MANLTRAQRHNRMLDRVFEIYNKQQEEKLKEHAPSMSEALRRIKEAGIKALEMNANGESVDFKNILGYMAEIADMKLKEITI